MKKADFLIIGGGVAGTTAAETIRDNDQRSTITIVSEEEKPLYSRVLLPEYIRGDIPYEKIFVRKVGSYEENDIEVLEKEKASRIDTHNKTVMLSSGKEIQFNKLLIASGTKLNLIDAPGKELKGIVYLRTKEDARQIVDYLSVSKKAVVVGAGFIGAEFAQSFAKKGLQTVCLIRESYFWSKVVGENSGRLLSQILEDNGVQIIANCVVAEFIGHRAVERVKINNGQEIPADLVGIGIGVHPSTDYLKGSELESEDGVVANQFLETRIPNIWAAGDVAKFYDSVFGTYHRLGNWSNAVLQGRIAGLNMVSGWGEQVDNRQEFKTVSSYTISIFGVPFTFMGDTAINDKTEILERGSLNDKKIARLFLREDKLVGASLINLSSERAAIAELIKRREKIKVSREKLEELSFDLNKLID